MGCEDCKRAAAALERIAERLAENNKILVELVDTLQLPPPFGIRPRETPPETPTPSPSVGGIMAVLSPWTLGEGETPEEGPPDDSRET